MKKDFRKICVLKGGISTERDISLLSGAGMAEAARHLGYEVSEFDFRGDIIALCKFIKENSPDCIINGLHGAGGEDGNIKAVLNFLKIPYTHSGVAASSVGMNKSLSELIFQHNGIRVPRAKLYKWEEFRANPDFPLPFVIKPVNGGSSCGVFIIKDVTELNDINWTYGETVYVTEYIPGLELSCGVLDGKALGVTNIIVRNGFYDYENKYTDGAATHELPANIPAEIRDEAERLAEKAHQLLGCKGLTRTDFRYNDVTRELYVLEINTQPGMSPMSLVPEQAKYVGISFDQLVARLIDKADYEEM